ncbi:MAG: HipA N-terminal domain-containing protein [Prolixibacteraceae bacterium]|nr:HipA N-terminal domain-containing protein [Prolixibacteraceae bacterium]MDI9563651.1 HipA N-terminal domain-containing protein [Bacteroidota bacterium]HQB27360.1 HipA N-terminal domain-containing protein [Paludibacter sp.]HOC87096.1 HipA N-terminal domain-containing protein [Prolixibacteraceae bacterium]HOG96582.1 HipA N-terminal domain-containing protein [Prolixibacteraceae bacterium]
MLIEIEPGKKYRFVYNPGYRGNPVSLTLPVRPEAFEFDTFPPFFDGLLPEGYQVEGLLKFSKIDRNDLFSQLMAVGEDMVGNTTAKEVLL